MPRWRSAIRSGGHGGADQCPPESSRRGRSRSPSWTRRSETSTSSPRGSNKCFSTVSPNSVDTHGEPRRNWTWHLSETCRDAGASRSRVGTVPSTVRFMADPTSNSSRRAKRCMPGSVGTSSRSLRSGWGSPWTRTPGAHAGAGIRLRDWAHRIHPADSRRVPENGHLPNLKIRNARPPGAPAITSDPHLVAPPVRGRPPRRSPPPPSFLRPDPVGLAGAIGWRRLRPRRPLRQSLPPTRRP